MANQEHSEARLLALVEQARKGLSYPPNGNHYCRWCEAGSRNGWSHVEGCGYVHTCAEVDAARNALDELAAALRRLPQGDKH